MPPDARRGRRRPASVVIAARYFADRPAACGRSEGSTPELRRANGGIEDDKIQVADLLLDGESRRIFIADQPLEMGPTEFNLLQFFMSHPERAYTRGQLLDQVWGANVYVEERTIDVHIRRLRKALQSPAGDYSHLIQTVRGTGYRFSARGLA